MMRGLVFLWVIAFFVIFYLILRSISAKKWKRYCAEVIASDDVNFLFRHLTSEFPVEVRKTAEARLFLLAHETDDPDLLLKINDHIRLDDSDWENISARLSPEKLLLKIAPEIKLNGSILENALEQIGDNNTLADIAKNKEIPESIRKQALSRITDNEILFSILLRYYPEEEAENVLDEKQMEEFGFYLCRHGHHDFDDIWEKIDEETAQKFEGKLRRSEWINKCRRCGKIRGRSWNDNMEERGWDYWY